MMTYKPAHFAACAVNPLAEGKLYQHPKLTELLTADWSRDAVADPHLDAILRWVVCVYDPKSPLVTAERELVRRKGAAAQLVNLDSSITEDVINGSYGTVAPAPAPVKKKKGKAKANPWDDEEVAEELPAEEAAEKTGWLPDLVFEYLRTVVKSRDWLTITALEYSFYESLRLLMQPIKGGKDKEVLEAVQKKNTIKAEIANDSNRLDEFIKRFFADDTVVEETVKRKRYTPQGVAGVGG